MRGGIEGGSLGSGGSGWPVALLAGEKKVPDKPLWRTAGRRKPSGVDEFIAYSMYLELRSEIARSMALTQHLLPGPSYAPLSP